MKPLRGRDRLTRVLAVLMVLVYRSGPSSPSGARSIPKVSSSSGSIAQDLSSEGRHGCAHYSPVAASPLCTW